MITNIKILDQQSTIGSHQVSLIVRKRLIKIINTSKIKLVAINIRAKKIFKIKKLLPKIIKRDIKSLWKNQKIIIENIY